MRTAAMKIIPSGNLLSVTSRAGYLRTSLAARSVTAGGYTRGLRTSGARWIGKETKEGNQDRANEAEAAKQDQLKKAQQTGQGEHKEALSSESESAIAAENTKYGEDTKTDIKRMQEKTEGKPVKEHEK